MRAFEQAMQNATEFGRFTAILQREGVRSYLEIGARNGGSFWRVANALEIPSKMMAVDLPWGKGESEPNLRACVEAVKQLGHHASLIIGDSTAPEVIEEVRAFGPFDAVFIDGCHLEPYVRKDWANYGPMGTKIVAFHDISWKGPRPGKQSIDVPQVWNEIKAQFPKHEEIKLEARDNGIGVLWRT